MTGLSGPIKFNSDGDLMNPAYELINVIGTGYRRIGYWSNHSGISVVPPDKKQPNHSSLYSVIWPGQTSHKPRGWVFPNNGRHLKIGIPHRVSFREFVSVTGTNAVAGFCIDVFTVALNLLPYAPHISSFHFGMVIITQAISLSDTDNLPTLRQSAPPSTSLLRSVRLSLSSLSAYPSSFSDEMRLSSNPDSKIINFLQAILYSKLETNILNSCRGPWNKVSLEEINDILESGLDDKRISSENDDGYALSDDSDNLTDLNRLVDGGADWRRVGKLSVSDKEIALGSNDKEMAYISCTCSLDDLIQMNLDSSHNSSLDEF
ncbi:hypothetical protein LWI29_009994 [Acer saccharum]|uniref:Uncharacterized protein n=1 Tax=Acer saccharum TaxID=4024 RepID=A0AA39T1L6_ACESA|nr:hypothetical protein LWI29_009994 [Acer saccharum]